MSPQTIGLIANTAKTGAKELLGQLQAAFVRADVTTLMEKETAALIGTKSNRSTSRLW